MQNVNMKQPPDVVSSKDMYYIQDMLDWNLTSAKITRDFAGKVKDQEISRELGALYEMHKRHYDQFIAFLQNHTNTNVQ